VVGDVRVEVRTPPFANKLQTIHERRPPFSNGLVCMGTAVLRGPNTNGVRRSCMACSIREQPVFRFMMKPVLSRQDEAPGSWLRFRPACDYAPAPSASTLGVRRVDDGSGGGVLLLHLLAAIWRHSFALVISTLSVVATIIRVAGVDLVVTACSTSCAGLGRHLRPSRLTGGEVVRR
jgi:hypothetical protein